jgi:hypothetical protein
MEELCSSYYQENKDHVIKRSKKYNKENILSQAKNHAKWIKNSNYDMNRYNTDIQYRLIKIQRARINAALKGKNKSKTTRELLGCTIDFFKDYIESKFLPDMTWDNYGKHGWHIDHIFPISAFDLTIEEELKKACRYTNLQPLWATDNIKKRDKIMQPSKPTVYLLVGAPSAGKSWIANQLLDKYHYVSYDGQRKKNHLDLLRTPSDKPKLYDPTFKISTIIRRHSEEFNFVLVGIYETEEVLKSRMLSRGGEWTDTIMKRNEVSKKRFEKYGTGGFLGTSQECFEFLKNI